MFLDKHLTQLFSDADTIDEHPKVHNSIGESFRGAFPGECVEIN